MRKKRAKIRVVPRKRKKPDEYYAPSISFIFPDRSAQPLTKGGERVSSAGHTRRLCMSPESGFRFFRISLEFTDSGISADDASAQINPIPKAPGASFATCMSGPAAVPFVRFRFLGRRQSDSVSIGGTHELCELGRAVTRTVHGQPIRTSRLIENTGYLFVLPSFEWPLSRPRTSSFRPEFPTRTLRKKNVSAETCSCALNITKWQWFSTNLP